MTDVIDDGNAAADLYTQAAIENARIEEATPPRTGLCLNCSEPVSEGSFCNDGGECREDYMKRKRMRG